MGRKWANWERGVLIEKYPDCRTSDIVPLLDRRTYSGVTGQASAMGLKKSEAFMSSILSGRTMGQHQKATQFKKGDAAWNKGKKLADYMSPEKIEKIKRNQFKKGSLPHNTVPIGHERITIDGYVEVKVTDHPDDTKNKNFKLKQRVVWEAENGPIPKDHVLIFKDGNGRNFDIENLELITKKENLNRNRFCGKAIVKRYFKIYDDELIEKFINENRAVIEQKRKTILLNQKINRHHAKRSK
jgi:hypothetical protein